MFPGVSALFILTVLIPNEAWEGFKDLIQLGLPTSNEWVGSFFLVPMLQVRKWRKRIVLLTNDFSSIGQ